MANGHRRRAGKASKLTLVAVFGILVLGSVISAVPAAATSGIGVYVAYADSLRADPTNFPTPWAGSPRTVFQGCAPVQACTYDGGAVQVLNNTGSTVTVNAITVHIDSCAYTGWLPTVLAPGAGLIVTQLASGVTSGCTGPIPNQMDSSDIGKGGASNTGNCSQDDIIPAVEVTINGTTTSYNDTGQVLNTGGIDLAECPHGTNESTQWTTIGHSPCRGSALSLWPSTQTHPVGTTATVTATFTNSCGQPLANVNVNFAVQSGPNAGRNGSSATDASGMAPFSYSSALAGTDTLGASITNLAGTIPSSTVLVIWVAFAPGGGAFVISDLRDVSGHSVYWWGAQWWKQDPLTSGLAPAAFKGYELSNSTPWCGQTWTTRPGNSPHPPSVVPNMMAVIVASHVSKKGSVISGDIVHVVLVQTRPGYGPNPGHPGSGTIIRTLC